ncbi:MAG: tRNA epoxyqueuosine(34) reductase QueG [Pirellulales bacterium]
MPPLAANATDLTARLKREAQRLGFALSGACPAVTPPGFVRFQEWLASGFAGEMRYLSDRAPAYEHPGNVLDGVRTILMLAMPYRTAEPKATNAGQGKVSRYAWGQDYHELIWQRLDELAAWLSLQSPGCRVRGVVDTAPLLEREFAQLAGLGWVGKNTLLLNKDLGSWFFLAALLTDAELDYDEPYAADHCGTCTACLDACPTDAFVAPYVLDARKCISYLTIELRSPIPEPLREEVGEWLFGCDVCQDVCPWNTRAHNAAHTDEPVLQPAEGMNPVDLIELFDLDEEAFRRRFRQTPLWRAKRRGLLRNAAIVLGNRPTEAAIAALMKGLGDSEPLVREACAWALERHPISEEPGRKPENELAANRRE